MNEVFFVDAKLSGEKAKPMVRAQNSFCTAFAILL